MGISERKSPLGRPKGKWVDNINIIRCIGWILIAQVWLDIVTTNENSDSIQCGDRLDRIVRS